MTDEMHQEVRKMLHDVANRYFVVHANIEFIRENLPLLPKSVKEVLDETLEASDRLREILQNLQLLVQQPPKR